MKLYTVKEISQAHGALAVALIDFLEENGADVDWIEMSMGTIAESLDSSKPTISRTMRSLQAAGIAEFRHLGPRAIYRLIPAAEREGPLPQAI